MPMTKLYQFTPTEVRSRLVRASAAAIGIHKDKDIAERLHISETSLSNRFVGRAKWNLDDLEWMVREFSWGEADIASFVTGRRYERKG